MFSKQINVLITAVLPCLMMILMSCSQEPAVVATLEKPKLTIDNYPQADGSTACIPLMVQMYAEFCELSPDEAEGAVTASGDTAAAWGSILNGDADFALVYEAPESLQSSINENNLEITSIGRDALVFLVNNVNPVSNLTQEQLIGIYTGEITDWGSIGGKGPLKAFQRNEGNGSQTLFLKLLMKDIKPMEPLIGLIPYPDGMGMMRGTAVYNGSEESIGYTVFYYADQMYQNPAIKLLSVDGTAPSAKSIQSGNYPLINDFYAVIRAAEPIGSPARQLRDWLLTAEGSQFLTGLGYISIN